MKIGFDFGMTNSTISFFDDEGKLMNFKLSASANEYVPTVVSYNNKKTEDVIIGTRARNKITNKNFDTYEKFKLKLGTKFSEPIPGKTKTPNDVTCDFINCFLKSFREGQNEDIKEIVMTVPATWIKENSNQTTMENIEDIFSRLGYENEIQLESEPVAAAVFFCYSYKNKHDSEYNGFITVIDYGGGTLDVTLCKAEGDKVKVLERYGYGEDNETKGQAGVAFDEAVTDKLIADNGLDIIKGSSDYIKLCDQFEREKITESDTITEQLNLYFDDSSILEGEYVFSLEYGDEQIDVKCEDLVHCFNKINAPVLESSLKEAKEYFEVHKIDDSSQDNFKVLLVGGFSNFYAVETTVRKFFGSAIGYEDKRFEQPFPIMNRSFAISRGAALIANGIIRTIRLCPFNIGHVTYKIKGGEFIPEDKLVIQIGTPLTEVKTAVFSSSILHIKHTAAKLRVFFDDGRPNGVGRRELALEEQLSDLFPNINADNEYKIGFSLNRNTVPTLHIVDKDGEEKKTFLFGLYEKIGIVEA